MGFDIKDQFKEHKKILLPGAGVLVMALLIAILSTKGITPFSLDSDITNPGVDNITNTTKEAPTMQLKSNTDYQAVIKTSKGNITIDLYETDTPVAVNNFVVLAKRGFFDNLTFHRIVKNFVIQGGDPLGTGAGGPGYKFKDEIDADALGLNTTKVKDATYLRSFFTEAVLEDYKNKSVKELYEDELGYKYTKGYGTHAFAPYVIAMANSGAGTNGSQFFITSASFSGEYLNGKHTIFGKVISGSDVVDAIEAVSTDQNGKPTSEIKIKTISISEK